MVAKIGPVRVTRGGRCCARLTRRFFKACVIAQFRNQFARGQKTIGSQLKIKEPGDSGNNGIQQEAPGSGTTKPFHPLDGESGVASMCILRHIKDIDLEVWFYQTS